METCKHCGHKTNTHHNCNSTCTGCGMPLSINTDVVVVGTLNEDYEVDMKNVPVSSSDKGMYHYQRFVPHLNLFVSKANELYRIKGWYGHFKDVPYWQHRISM